MLEFKGKNQGTTNRHSLTLGKECFWAKKRGDAGVHHLFFHFTMILFRIRLNDSGVTPRKLAN